MINFLKLYSIALPVFLFIDFIWLAFVATKFYKTYLSFLISPTPNLMAALVFYLIFVVGLVVFVIQPSLHSSSWVAVILRGALFGLVCYATYDLTNQATIAKWPVIVTVVDLVWGAFVSSAVAVIVTAIANKINL